MSQEVLVMIAGTSEVADILQQSVNGPYSRDAIWQFIHTKATIVPVSWRWDITKRYPLIDAEFYDTMLARFDEEPQLKRIYLIADEQVVFELNRNPVARRCAYCRQSTRTTSLMRCQRCKRLYYCDATCQRRDWTRIHRVLCNAVCRNMAARMSALSV
jgi:hypothetical protein